MKKQGKPEYKQPHVARGAQPKSADKVVPEKQFVQLTRKNVPELRITSLDEDGYGTARNEDGMTFRVAGALPGDALLAGIDHVAGGTAFCHVKKLLNSSLLRSKNPPCDESADCFGCPLIAMKYTEQKNWKRGMILAELAKYPGLADAVVHPLLSPENLIHYRTTAKLTVAGKHSEPFIGIYRRASHDVYDLDNCPIHHPLINKVVEAVRKGIKKGKVPVYNPQSKMGLLRYLVVRVSTSEKKAMVVFVTAQRSYNEIHHLSRFVQDLVPEVEVISQNVNASEGNVIMGQKDFFLTKKLQLTERIGDVSFRISPRSFFQVNNSGAHLIYRKVHEWSGLTGSETVLDLYCGIGGISLFLAKSAKEIIGVEVVEEAVADATMNARINSIRNCCFEAGDVADLLDEMAEEKQHVDVAVLNPPRKGCDQKVLERLTALGPRSIIYVSCSPQSLARDLEILRKQGYYCREIQPVDMFPQTVHVESVARLEKV
ncbi:MAG: 23S rRNA (uracil(1939)-C(5))-methyltransferase RlmD [Desulfuromonadaceae bacterium]|nr:23S rRNA (uracil(1939)-C(5))-methyltransferase RlmD [Desulfuromonadaceae bacterium]MDD5105831.1 23S rRNA (uracil(1939)-C(5))-methyltransferase RlmD [Desulfuromonadaceae bacterium]